MRSFSIEHFGKRGHMGSIFSKRVRNLGPTEYRKVRKWWKSDVSKGDWAFVNAKLVAGGTGVFWIEGKGQNVHQKIENEGFRGLGGEGGSGQGLGPIFLLKELYIRYRNSRYTAAGRC